MKDSKLDPELLEKATEIFSELGLPVELAINVFLAKAVQAQGFPFPVALEGDNSAAQSAASRLSNAEITESIQYLVEERLSLSEIDNLTQLGYCRTAFGLSFPVLKISKTARPEDVRRTAKDAKGRNRYSTTKVAQRDGQTYLICTQWTDRHRPAFVRWQQTFGDS
ncbi:addiction module antitoxin [Vibrio parahaemolyticus]|uniref:addiction module antitoxin n=1 Tax=Vibrio parahaemolyticus TaxID=670 RepID=UPI00046E5568|nr:addiction module antitoxin [Vibrio parahaemolyticus]EJG1709571.1 addiction module antitoxin [Vibrio parahaemolyticus]EJG1744115.1 addiction module antitoxin [Vibrio parahaemolyticus]EJG1778536.1 addiction module antitoxin [Vibrio parahaemolyticus]MDF4731510.1 addiction module antitoxin [Vibrio parahaemolyticus]MDG2604721.1 addiction module antitoxin [Vibrio parahaemolyticus]